MNFTKKSILALFTLASAGVQATDTEEIEKITVFASKEPMLDSVKLDELENKAAGDLGEQLRQINGVSSGRQGGKGFSPVIRGQQNSQLNILLDGGQVSGACPASMDNATSYAGAGYDKVVVIKGNQSVLYGAGGSGGTILLERERPDFSQSGITGAIDMTATSNTGRRKFSADVAAGNDKGYVRIFGSADQQQDYYQDGDGNNVSAGYDSKSGGIVMGVDLTPDTSVELSYESVRDKNIFYSIEHPMDVPQADSDSWRIKLKQSITLGPFHTLEINAYRSDVYHVMDNFSVRDRLDTIYVPGHDMPMEGVSESNTSGGKVQAIATLGNTEVTVGMEYLNNYSDGTHAMDHGNGFEASAIEWPGVRQEQYSAFGEADMVLDSKNKMRFGFRVDRNFVDATKANDVPDMNVPGGFALNPTELYQNFYGSDTTEVDETNLGAVVGFSHQLAKDQVLSTFVTRSVVTANANQRFQANDMHGYYWVGNPDIKPEVHKQAELGWQKGDELNKIAVSVFYDKIDDYILQYKQSQKVELQKNVDATLYGMEAELSQPLSESWHFRTSLSWTMGRNVTEGGDLPQIAPLTNVNTLDWRNDDWSAGISWELAAKQDKIDMNSGLDAGETAGYGIVHLFASYKAPHDFVFKAGINNVFDKTYAQHLNKQSDGLITEAEQVNEPGREYWVNVNWQF